MGGESAEGKPGYNWGICPASTEKMLVGLKTNNAFLYVVDGARVRSLDISFPLDLYQEWNDQVNKSEVQLAFLEEFKNSMNGNVLASGKLLCDPATMVIALWSLTSYVKSMIDFSAVEYAFGPHTDNYLGMQLVKHSVDNNLASKNALLIESSLSAIKDHLTMHMPEAWKLL
jgi:hypothetical protein